MSARISGKPPSAGFVYVEVVGNGKHEAVSVGDTIVGGVWTGMGTTRKQFVVRIERLEEALADYKARAAGAQP